MWLVKQMQLCLQIKIKDQKAKMSITYNSSNVYTKDGLDFFHYANLHSFIFYEMKWNFLNKSNVLTQAALLACSAQISSITLEFSGDEREKYCLSYTGTHT